MAGLVLFPSAFIYRSLGLLSLYTPTLHCAGWFIAGTVTSILMTIVLSLSREFHRSVWLAFSGEQRLFWQLARIPTLLAALTTRIVSEHQFHIHR